MVKQLERILPIILICCCFDQSTAEQEIGTNVERVVIESDGWELIGDLQLPLSSPPYPAVFLFNQAAGERSVYAELANLLQEIGVASLRLDLRGHGESTNLGRFVPGEKSVDSMIWDAELDVIAAHKFLSADSRFDESRFGFVGASYSGEEVAEAGRFNGYGALYVLLSPGSFSEISIEGIDESGARWLFLASRDDRFLKETTKAAWTGSVTLELNIIPGASHGTDMLLEYSGLAERIAIWIAQRLH